MSDLKFLTGLRFAKGILNALNGMTFFFDPNWSYNSQSEVNFPIAFFHLVSIREVYEAQVSQKQMLFYNSQRSFFSQSTTGGMTQIVADNIVIRPKTYQLETIVPYSDLTLLDRMPFRNSEQFAAITAFMGSGKTLGAGANALPYLSLATPYLEILKSVLKTLVAADFSSAANFVKSIINSGLTDPEYNKNSLEAMFKNRSILKFKTWKSWKYKYVAITNMEISKESDEDGVYRANITCTELPIMTIRDTQGFNIGAVSNPVMKLAGKAVGAIVDAQETLE